MEIKMSKEGASLVAQWLRIHLPVKGIRVRSLVWEDPTCHGATKPVRHNYWACALEPASHNYWSPRATTTEAHVPQLLKPACHNYWSPCATITEARVPQLLKPARLEPVLRNKRSHRNEKPTRRNEEKPPLTATRESLHAATKTQCSQK